MIKNTVYEILEKITKNKAPSLWEPSYIFAPGDLDSLDMATLALSIEESFGVKVTDENLNEINSIEKIINFINSHKKN